MIVAKSQRKNNAASGSWGVSVVICCHNSAARLPQTLAHLAAQETRPDAAATVPWEVIVVDNGSTDRTAAIALELWPQDAPAPLRVVKEEQLGLIFARLRGFAEANFALVSFIDDDNWPCVYWVEMVADVMRRYPMVGACGGRLTAVSDSVLPVWFDQFAQNYAVGPQSLRSGDVTTTRGYLWGAGITIRKAAWEQLRAVGFSPLLPGRSGVLLSGGEDHEICLALQLAGWRLWYDEQLHLQHYLPPQRLEWSYLCRLHRGFGASQVVLGIYMQYLDPPSGLYQYLRQNWLFEVMGSVCLVTLTWAKSYLTPALSAKAHRLLLQRNYYRGKLQMLLNQRHTYAQVVTRIHALAGRLKRCTVAVTESNAIAVNPPAIATWRQYRENTNN